MGRIPDHILNEIQDRCDIVEVISGYVPLKPAGRNFKANCPFHHEKTPSFIVSPDKQIYHCFGCNSGGNVFNFVKEYEKIDFVDAVKTLAAKAGIKIPESRSSGKNEDSFVSNALSINDIASDFYAEALKNSAGLSPVRRYLEKRGIDETIVGKFKLGYADSNWTSLSDYLSKRGISKDIIFKTGLAGKGRNGSFYDLFRDRLIFPIFDVRGRVLGFGARVLGDALPKYINSPESAAYKKGRHLYGLNFSKAGIREKGFSIITEGYLDVITCHQYGINNVISSLGTALTVDQIRLLRRYSHNVVMVYDADQAGEMATLRGLDLFLEEGMNVKVATLDSGHDPDSYLKKFGPRGFGESIKKAKTLFCYKLDVVTKRVDGTEPEGKAEIVKEMLSTISKVRNAVIKSEYIKNLANILSLKEEAIWEELKKTRPGGYKGQGAKGKTKIDKKIVNISPAERILTKLMLEDVEVVNRVRDSLTPFDFSNPDIRHVVEALFNLNTEEGYIDVTRLINFLEDKVEPHVISYIANEEIDIKNKEKNVFDCIKVIKKNCRDKLLNDIQNRLSDAQKNGHDSETKKLLEEFNKIIKGGV